MKFVLLILVLSVSSIYYGNAMTCEEEGFLGLTRLITCPRPTDRPTSKYCCGTENHVLCCDNPLGIDEEDFQRLAAKLPAILGTIVAVVICLVVLCVVCCCCCPFCLIYKKRSRGAIHNPAPTVTQMQPQQSYVPVQTSYANQPYPPQPTYPPANQGYGMASQPGYGPPPSNAPYPISQPPYPTTPLNASNEQPPPYAEKQLPYNPNY